MIHKPYLLRGPPFEDIQDLIGIIEDSPDGILGVNNQGIIQLFTGDSERITGFVAEEVVGEMHISDLYANPREAREIMKAMMNPRYGPVGVLRRFETNIKHRSGWDVPISLSATMFYDKDGGRIGNYGIYHDISIRKKLERENQLLIEKLEKLTIEDPLTGLNNRRHFEEMIQSEWSRANRHEEEVCLVYSDIDHFKQINDSYGHPTGDKVLKLYANTLKDVLRGEDSAFRIGGDEFAIILPKTSTNEAVVVGQRIIDEYKERHKKESANSLDYPYSSISMGVASLRIKQETAEEWRQKADVAMYEAKKFDGDYISISR